MCLLGEREIADVSPIGHIGITKGRIVMVKQEIELLYERYVRLATKRKDEVLSFKDWQDYRNKIVGMS